MSVLLDANVHQGLNKEQHRFATSESKHILAIAGPGSGKTHSLTHRVADLIVKGVDPKRILLMTFTNKAADEIKARVASMLGSSAGGVVAGTFHSIGVRFLRRFGHLVERTHKFTILDESDSLDLMAVCFAETTAQLPLDKFDREYANPRRVLRVLSVIKGTNRPFDDVWADLVNIEPLYDEYRSIFQDSIREYEWRKVKSDAFDFDDLIFCMLRVIEKHPNVEERFASQFDHILVDEYQDTNITQALIVKRLAQYANLAVVGDDAQSIYRFNGAEVGNILDFPMQFADVEIIQLEENYRSSPEILDLANVSISNNRRQFKKTLRANKPAGVIPVHFECVNQRDEARRIVDEMVSLNSIEGFPFDEMAVLYRSSYLSRFIEMELSKQKIPYQVFGGTRFFEREQIKDTLAWLRIDYNPNDEVAWHRVLSMQKGIGPASLRAIWKHTFLKGLNPLEASAKGYTPPQRAAMGWANAFDTLGRVASKLSVSDKILATLTDGYVILVKKKHKDDADERLEHIASLSEYASSYSSVQGFLEGIALDPISLDGSGREHSAEGVPTVTLSTVHSAKGKEWDVVFVMGLSEGLFPTNNDGEDVEEARRLFFVAVTRPRDRLYLTRPMSTSRGGRIRQRESSMFLDEVKNLFEMDGTPVLSGLPDWWG